MTVGAEVDPRTNGIAMLRSLQLSTGQVVSPVRLFRLSIAGLVAGLVGAVLGFLIVVAPASTQQVSCIATHHVCTDVIHAKGGDIRIRVSDR
jgi:predicted lysophospholipase L1 biosynthesis ABC-type transport system permease subunit